MKLTEEAVCKAYEARVQAAINQLHGVDREEALQVARMGLLYAIRTWRAGAGEFEGYARKRIQEQVTLFKRCLNDQQRAEARLSLDQQVRPGESEATYADMLAFVEADQTAVDVALFIRQLKPEARLFVRLRMREYENSEIAGIMQKTPSYVDKLHDQVMDEAATYFELGETA